MDKIGEIKQLVLISLHIARVRAGALALVLLCTHELA
jgi:hypothetical protein